MANVQQYLLRVQLVCDAVNKISKFAGSNIPAVMYSLLKKELSVFFGSLIGYLVIGIFLLLNSLYLWVFESDMNVLDMGYANLDGFFFIAPYMFLFLSSAITMKMFADEERNGTMELLFTHPMTSLQIISAKYLAGLVLCLMALTPCLVHFLSIYLLASPLGNVDIGGLWGAFIGLCFLFSAFTAIGLFASSVNANQIVAFLLSLSIGFLFVSGFDALAQVMPYGIAKVFVLKLGVGPHFSTMSKGVIDLRDTLYFATIIVGFGAATNYILLSRRK